LCFALEGSTGYNVLVTGIDRVDRIKLARVSRLLVDIDDTLSTHGKLTSTAYAALWQLREAGLDVAVVTGRPAGWCDHIARFWPVDAVIGENWAFYFYHDGSKLRQRFIYSGRERRVFRERLESVREKILAEVPGTALASDQAYRESDLAIDFCEDVAPLERAAVLRIKQIFEDAGAHAKISSIHVNGWFGEFDKLSTVRLWARERLNLDLDRERDTCVFCGDSPNDEPMFQFFPLSFAMANVRPFLPLIEHPPAFICDQECGAGFCQVVELLLQARAFNHT
jgi:HAD superfamily hydrolase (TIGR01484 family)